MIKNKILDNIKNKKLLFIAASCFFVLLIAVLVFVFWGKCKVLFFGDNQRKIITVENKSAVASCQDCVRRRIDGVYVPKGEENFSPIAVIIENLFEARPQSGLSRANLVYEAEAEGRITRFLAFFADGNEVKKIGPIRSARPYFVDWVRELSALFVHVGGSPEALVKIKQENIFDMNEFYQGGYFWRDEERIAPHNVYTSSENTNKYLEKNQVFEGRYSSWVFKDDTPVKDANLAQNIKIDFDFSDFKVFWEYDKENNDYVRHMDSKIHYDAEGRAIKAKNIVVQYVKAKVIDNVLRLKMEHIGEGESILCQDGICETGKWMKQSGALRTRFYRNSGEEFQFNAGPTWVEIVRPEIEVEF